MENHSDKHSAVASKAKKGKGRNEYAQVSPVLAAK